MMSAAAYTFFLPNILGLMYLVTMNVRDDACHHPYQRQNATGRKGVVNHFFSCRDLMGGQAHIQSVKKKVNCIKYNFYVHYQRCDI